MLNVEIENGVEARRKILRGVEKVGEIVGSSLGPKGRNTIIKTKYSAPQITNDGVTIARHIMLKDPIEDLGAQTLIDGAMKADERAGDGTSTATVLAAKAVSEYAKKIEEEDKSHSDTGTVGEASTGTADVNKMAREILDTGKHVIEELKKVARPLKKDELKNVVSSSLGTMFPEYVDMVAELVEEVGEGGYISVEDNWATKYGIETELIKGNRFTGTYATPYMITNIGKKEAVYEDVAVLVCNHDIATTAQMKELLKEVVQSGTRKLVIIANKFEKGFVNLMASTTMQARGGDIRLIDYLCIKAPSLTSEQWEDVSVYCDATFFDKNNINLDMATTKGAGAHLGFVRKIVVSENEVIMLDGRGAKGTAVKERLKLLKEQAEDEKDPAFKEQTKRRIGALQSGFAVIRVGAATEGERIIVKKKIEDAYQSAQSAMVEGVVAGGGQALKTIAEQLGKEHAMYIPLCEPYNLIQKSAGGKLKIPNTVLDPLKVTRIAVESACSVAASLITVEAGISEKSKSMWDELDAKLQPQNDVADDFRQDENQEQGFR